ncbi:hypothetical protein ISCGN_005386 [Ixodes scapularis]
MARPPSWCTETSPHRGTNSTVDIPHDLVTVYPPKRGGTKQKTNMDREIAEAEVRSAISKLKHNSAPGPDGITNRTLRNLDDSSITDITDYINTCWREGRIPESWKHAKVILIPKRGKPLTLEHLRPISLTSCLGKLMEHIILDRLTNHMNDADLFPHTMVGFRTGLSTQDILLQLSEQIIKSTGNLDTAAILALDLTKAFDNVNHESILGGLGSVNPGERTYNYIKAFLSGRTAVINVGDLTSDTTQLGSRGTPQGAVLSAILFNLAVINIPKRLGRIPQLRHSLYADDITLWIGRGSDAHIKETLQQGVDIVAEEAERAAGRISKPALKILHRNAPQTSVRLVWTPAHAGFEGNEAAHEQARGYTIRAGPSLHPYHGARSARDRPSSFHEITTHYLLSRQVYPPADKSLTLEQAHSWRQLQTGTFPNPAILTHIFPSMYPTLECTLCGGKATLPHIIWACPQDPFPSIPSHDEWETSLRSSDPEVQSALVERAKEVAATTATTRTAL